MWVFNKLVGKLIPGRCEVFIVLGMSAQRSRKLSSTCCTSGDRKYPMTRRLPVLISTETAMPGLKLTGVPSTPFGGAVMQRCALRSGAGVQSVIQLRVNI